MMKSPPRGVYLGAPAIPKPAQARSHFIPCAVCNGWIDCRDLGSVFDHEGPLPHPESEQSNV
jgi:hypothetical protein